MRIVTCHPDGVPARALCLYKDGNLTTTCIKGIFGSLVRMRWSCRTSMSLIY